jgi:hypothetical protein
MEEKIQVLKNDVIKSEIKVSELLRRAKIIASELKDTKALRWIKREVGGYGKDTSVPDYRMVHGEPKGWNPYRGWIPFIGPDAKIQEQISKRGASQSVAELEDLMEGKKDSTYFEMPYPAEIQVNFSKAVEMDTKFSLFIPSTAIYGVLNSVRNRILDWLIEISSDFTSSIDAGINEDIIFPDELIKKLPADLKILADDFNFNFSNSRPIASVLILRRMLPLSIVRRFQKDNKEAEIKDAQGEYLEPKSLLGKIQILLSQERIYRELISYKQLTDGAQHLYTLNIQTSDVRGAGIALRVFLDDIF